MQNEMKNEKRTYQLVFGDSIIWLEKLRSEKQKFNMCCEDLSALGGIRVFLLRVEIALLDGEMSVEIKPGDLLKACEKVDGSTDDMSPEEMLVNLFHVGVISNIETYMFS